MLSQGSSYQLQIITTSGKSNTFTTSNNSLQLTALYPMTTYMVSIRSICEMTQVVKSDVIFIYTTKHVSVKDSIVRCLSANVNRKQMLSHKMDELLFLKTAAILH